MKFVHKYFLGQQAKGKKNLDENSYKDLHYMTTKYIELIGSVEFSSYLQNVLNNKLGLATHSQFQALLVDLMVNSVDLSTHGRMRAIALEKFVFLVLQLENPTFYQQFNDVKKYY
jgi:hypothetical protein